MYILGLFELDRLCELPTNRLCELPTIGGFFPNSR